MFFRQLLILFVVSVIITTFNVEMVQATENTDHITSFFPEAVVLGEPCRTCIPTVVECQSYIATSSKKICLPLAGYGGESSNIEINLGEETVLKSQNVSNSLDHTILEQIDVGNSVNNTIILQELY